MPTNADIFNQQVWERAQGGLGQVPTPPKAPSLLENIAGLANPISGVLQTIGGITSLIPKGDKGKETASELQQTIQRSITDIEQRVASGQMDVDAALAALDGIEHNISAFANTPSGDQDPNSYRRAAAQAGVFLQQAKANVQSHRTNLGTRPLDPGGFTGTPSLQREQFGTSIRNVLAGIGPGLPDTSPVRQLLTPRNPLERLPNVTQQVSQVFGSPTQNDFTTAIRKRLAERAAAPPTLY